MAQSTDPYSIPYTATSDDYSSVARLQDAPLADRIKIEVYNAGVAFQVERDRQWQPEERTGPWVGTLLRDGVNGIRFRSLVAGQSAVVAAAMDYDLGADVGMPPAFTVSAAGVVKNPVGLINGVTGRVSAAGAPISGTGYTIVHLATGQYQINFTTPFVTPPLLFLSSLGGFGENQFGFATTATQAEVTVYNSAGSGVDQQFDFLALAPQ